MTLLPIVERELRTASRRQSVYWNRTVTAGLALLLGAYVHLMSRRMPPADLGLALFAAVSWLAFLSALLAGTRLTADSISAERREQTLGLLFLTDLKGYDIVLGKLAAASIHAFCGLIAIVPVLSVALLLGGVSAGQVGRTALMLVTTMLCSLALGLWVSLWFREGRRAALVTGLVLMTVCLGPLLVPFVLFEVFGRGGSARFGSVMQQWAAFSPLYAQTIAVFDPARMGPAMPRGALSFWFSYSILALQGVLWLALASAILPHRWQDRTGGALDPKTDTRWQRWLRGSEPDRQRFRDRALALNPFYWLAARDPRQLYCVWGFLALVAAAALAFRRGLPFIWEEFGAGRYVLIAMAVHLVLRMWVAGSASRQLADDRRDGALELLLSTPLRDSTIFAGQFRALYRQFGAAFGAVLVADALFCWATLRENPSDSEAVLFWAGCMVLLPLDSYALAWQALWCAVSVRHTATAGVVAVARVLAGPWVVLLTLASLYHVLGLDRRGGRWEVTGEMAFGLWFGLGVGADLLLSSLARTNLRRRFRECAAHRARRTSAWRALFAGS